MDENNKNNSPNGWTDGELYSLYNRADAESFLEPKKVTTRQKS